MATFLATIRYETKGHETVLEVWVSNDRAPGVTTREEVEDALRQTAASGVAPEGWTVDVFNWSHLRSSGSDVTELQEFDSLIRAAEINVNDNPPPPPRPEEERGKEE